VHPDLVQIGPLTIHSYGLALAAAFIASGLWVRYELDRRGIAKEIAFDLVLAAAIGGIAGARLAFVVAHWSYFLAHPVEIVKLDEGGLVFYGGLAGGAIAVAALVRLKKLPVPVVADAAAPAVALGAALGRVGCFFNGCCYGRPTSSWLGITFPEPLGGPRLPTQVIDGLYNLGLFLVLAIVGHRFKLKTGFVFWLYVALYAVLRFGIEFMRDNSILVAGLSGAQMISIGAFVLAGSVLLLKYRRPLEDGVAGYESDRTGAEAELGEGGLNERP